MNLAVTIACNLVLPTDWWIRSTRYVWTQKQNMHTFLHFTPDDIILYEKPVFIVNIKVNIWDVMEFP